MKRSIPFYLLVFAVGHSFSQSLAGDWKGKFVTTINRSFIFPTAVENDQTTIRLRFLLNPDSTYTVYSFTKLPRSGQPDTTVVCKMRGIVTDDSAYLEEVRVVLPVGYPPACFQKMYLKIERRKKFTELSGAWESTGDNCDIAGTIYFKRKNE